MTKTLIIILLSIIIIALTLIIIKLLHNSPKAKGRQGERKVAKYLKKLPDNYIVLNNILLQNNIHSTQIDHIVFSPYGIFVIETKNYSGLIKGNETSESWTKTSYGKNYTFRNPILQNQAHIKALKHILSIKDDRKFIQIVTFSNRAKLKVHTSTYVVYYNRINKTILKNRKRLFSYSEAEKYAERIENAATANTLKAKKTHIKRIREKQNNYDKKIKRGICPKCGKKLIKRKNKFGKFLICSNHYHCDFKKKL